MVRYFGYNPPFLGGTQGVLSRQEDRRLIYNDVLQLLLTVPGERVHRPRFGTLLRSAPFEQLSQSALSEIQSSIVSALRLEEPRLSNVQVVVTGDPDSHVVQATVIGNLNFEPSVEFLLEVSLNEQGNVTVNSVKSNGR